MYLLKVRNWCSTIKVFPNTLSRIVTSAFLSSLLLTLTSTALTNGKFLYLQSNNVAEGQNPLSRWGGANRAAGHEEATRRRCWGHQGLRSTVDFLHLARLVAPRSFRVLRIHT